MTIIIIISITITTNIEGSCTDFGINGSMGLRSSFVASRLISGDLEPVGFMIQGLGFGFRV